MEIVVECKGANGPSAGRLRHFPRTHLRLVGCAGFVVRRAPMLTSSATSRDYQSFEGFFLFQGLSQEYE